jgi:hypothetical protein
VKVGSKRRKEISPFLSLLKGHTIFQRVNFAVGASEDDILRTCGGGRDRKVPLVPWVVLKCPRDALILTPGDSGRVFE